MFHGGLTGEKLSLRWIGRWDSLDGPVAVTLATANPDLWVVIMDPTLTQCFAAGRGGTGMPFAAAALNARANREVDSAMTMLLPKYLPNGASSQRVR